MHINCQLKPESFLPPLPLTRPQTLQTPALHLGPVSASRAAEQKWAGGLHPAQAPALLTVHSHFHWPLAHAGPTLSPSYVPGAFLVCFILW